jgi:hypothetical protein
MHEPVGLRANMTTLSEPASVTPLCRAESAGAGFFLRPRAFWLDYDYIRTRLHQDPSGEYDR